MRKRILPLLLVAGFLFVVGYAIARTCRQCVQPRGEPLYRGNERNMVFHGPDCHFFRADGSTTVLFSREEAIEAGYQPCKVCRP